MGHSGPGDIVAVIMAGGAGTRFWPSSTPEKPKQFLKLFAERSLLRMSFDRIAGLVDPEKILVLTHESFADKVAEQIPELDGKNIIGEPLRRDTAAAVALAACLCRRRFGDPVMAVLTADHLIEPVDSFHDTLLSAARACRESGGLYTFGIPPTRPATSFGYLEKGDPVPGEGRAGHFRLLRFLEKPSASAAEAFLKSGKHLWNSGMFAWTTSSILSEMTRQLPLHVERVEKAVSRDGEADWRQVLFDAFEPLEKTSIDYGVMENARDVFCIEAPFSWEDVGGWLAMREHLPLDELGNATMGKTFVLDSRGNLVFSEDPGETVALLGVRDLIVVRSGKRTLVAGADQAERIRDLVDRMKDEDASGGPTPGMG
ncbi:MAG: mannose-1-phosphate guanylyltransferase [Planctomycetota bacterium]|jgi:mannose-1-phosphate guanylyltransferase